VNGSCIADPSWNNYLKNVDNGLVTGNLLYVLMDLGFWALVNLHSLDSKNAEGLETTQKSRNRESHVRNPAWRGKRVSAQAH
jgi:hypothetical protein